MVYSVSSQSFQPIRYIQGVKKDINELNQQISSGKRASDYVELGSEREFTLVLETRIAKSNSYSDNVKTAKTILAIAGTSIDTVRNIFQDAQASAYSSTLTATDTPRTVIQKTAEGELGNVFGALNVDYAGRYLFSGQATNEKPLAPLSEVLDGRGNLDGYNDYVADRWEADRGSAGLGRLSVTHSGTDVTLAEDGPGHPFGFKIEKISSALSQVVATGPTGATNDLSLDFSGGVPSSGEEVTFGLKLPNGESLALTLTATTSDDPDVGEFTIDPASTTNTAANFNTALNAALTQAVDTDLRPASASAAADNFFFDAAQGAPLRVDTSTAPDAVALIQGTPGDTVFWYQGDPTTDSPRERVNARVSDHTEVDLGFQANENGFLEGIKALATLSQLEFDPTSDNDADAYRNLVQNTTDQLTKANAGPGTKQIQIDLVVAQSGVQSAEETNEREVTFSTGLLAEIQNVELDEAAVQFQSLITQLEATYKTAAVLRNFSLLNYV